jgi:hypothetical protein
MKAAKSKKKPHARIRIDYQSIGSIDHVCNCCSGMKVCCCSKYEVSVDSTELNRILRVLPEAAKLCPHLKTQNGYDSVFEEGERGLHAIDQTEEGLCVFAYRTQGMIRCSLHSIEISLGLPLGTIKPKMCILWPLTFTQGGDALTLHDDALSFKCNRPRKKPSHRISPALRETIEYIRKM